MAKKNKPLNASTARVRISPKKRSTRATRELKRGARTKRAAGKQPPRKLFDAMKWCGILPELAGGSLAIQRQMRNEW
ncbi:MAG: hypothetical protein IPP33_15645 [Flavobacteriales bacterium]|nr:hypothetical protein [Flavobacteriales bacterium]